MKTIFLSSMLLVFFHSTAFSNCELVEKASLAMAIHASNWSNAITTRIPSGGPYKYKTVVCKNKCEVVEQLKTISRHEPGHPDANSEGNVSYPDIDKSHEHIILSAYAQVLRQIGKTCPEKIKVIDNTTSAFIEYKQGDIKLDIFNFSADTNLVSWARVTRSTEQIINF